MILLSEEQKRNITKDERETMINLKYDFESMLNKSDGLNIDSITYLDPNYYLQVCNALNNLTNITFKPETFKIIKNYNEKIQNLIDLIIKNNGLEDSEFISRTISQIRDMFIDMEIFSVKFIIPNLKFHIDAIKKDINKYCKNVKIPKDKIFLKEDVINEKYVITISFIKDILFYETDVIRSLYRRIEEVT